MLTREANERLAQVGPGTPGGNLLRRYWHPIATVVELEQEPVLPVKLLGENLALYKSPNGDLGLMAERCPHRGASMVYGTFPSRLWLAACRLAKWGGESTVASF